MDVITIPNMPETDERQPFADDRDDVGFGYLESNLSWAERNNEAVEWLIENHRQIRKILRKIGQRPKL